MSIACIPILTQLIEQYSTNTCTVLEILEILVYISSASQTRTITIYIYIYIYIYMPSTPVVVEISYIL
jgi:hypothetical protein